MAATLTGLRSFGPSLNATGNLKPTTDLLKQATQRIEEERQKALNRASLYHQKLEEAQAYVQRLEEAYSRVLEQNGALRVQYGNSCKTVDTLKAGHGDNKTILMKIKENFEKLREEMLASMCSVA